MIDNIEYNLNNTNEFVEEGKVQTTKAIEYKKKATKVNFRRLFMAFV
jgi:hypothetical protein